MKTKFSQHHGFSWESRENIQVNYMNTPFHCLVWLGFLFLFLGGRISIGKLSFAFGLFINLAKWHRHTQSHSLKRIRKTHTHTYRQRRFTCKMQSYPSSHAAELLRGGTTRKKHKTLKTMPTECLIVKQIVCPQPLPLLPNFLDTKKVLRQRRGKTNKICKVSTCFTYF